MYGVGSRLDSEREQEKESANEVDAVALTSNMAAADHFVNSIR